MKSLFLCLLLTLPAAAQRKLWTWTPSPANSPTVKLGHQILASSTSLDGTAVIALAEVRFDGEPLQFDRVEYRIIMIDPKGAKVFDLDFSSMTKVPDRDALTGKTPVRWSVTMVKPGKFAVSTGDHVIVITRKGKKLTWEGIDLKPDEEVHFQPAASAPTYFKSTRVPVGAIEWQPGDTTQYFTFSAVELWSLK